MTLRPRLLALCCLALAAAGCAAYSASRNAEEAFARGDFEQAVTFYEEAVRLKPADEDYAQGLSRARHAAAQNAQLEGDAARNAGDLNLALRRFSRSAQLEQSAEVSQRIDETEKERAEASTALGRAQEDLAAGRLEPALSGLRGIERYAATFSDLPALIDSTTRTLCDQAVAAGIAAFDGADYAQAQVQAHRGLTFRPGDPAATELSRRVAARLRSVEAAQEGAARLLQAQYREAVAAYQRAVQEDPTNAPAQASLESSRVALAEWLRREAEGAARAGRQGRALTLLREALAPELPAGALRADLEDRARRLTEELAARLDQKESASRAQNPGAAFAYHRAAAVLRAGESAPAPDLGPLLGYSVELVPAAGSALAGRVLSAIAERVAPQLPANVALVGAGTRADAQLRVAVSSVRYDHTIPAVERRSAAYIERIDLVPNPRHRELRRAVRELSEQERVVGARLEGERGALGYRRQQVERAEQQVRREQREAEQAARQEADRLHREAGEQSNRAAALASQAAALDAEERRVRDELRREQHASERNQLQSRLSDLERREQELRREARQASDRADALMQQARQVTENPPETEDLRRARRELHRAREEEQSFVAHTVAPLEGELRRLENDRSAAASELAGTPDRVESPVEAVYTYAVEHHRLSAAATATATVFDRALREERLRQAASSERSAEDTTFPGASVRGAPGLYLPPDPLELPSEEIFERDLVAELADRLSAQVLATLAGHRARFLALAERARGEERLGQLVLAWQSGLPLEGTEARQAILDACGLDVASGTVDPERLDR